MVRESEIEASYFTTEGNQSRVKASNSYLEKNSRESKRSKDLCQNADPEVLELFKPDTIINKRYKVVCAVERGKFGQVFKCLDTKNKDKLVAAKISSSTQFDIDNAKVESKLM